MGSVPERILEFYHSVFEHIETLRYEIDPRREGCVLLENEDAVAAVQAVRKSRESPGSRIPLPLPVSAQDFIEDRRSQDFEGLSFALGVPVVREAHVLRPVFVVPVDVFDSADGLRAFPGRREIRVNPAFEGETDAGEALRSNPFRLVPAGPPAAVLYAFTDADYLIQLKKDTAELIERAEEIRSADTCLRFLLRNRRPPLAGEVPRFGSRTDVPLTRSQDAALRWIFSRRITPIEGPPGTGKTTLITELCARTIVHRALQAAGILPRRGPFEHTVLVTSTNNKAVRNVAEAFEEGPGLFAAGRRSLVAEAVERMDALLRRMIAEPDPREGAREVRRRLVRLHRQGGRGRELLRTAREFLYWRTASDPSRRAGLTRVAERYLRARRRGRWESLANLLADPFTLEAFYDLFPVLTCTTLSIRNLLPLDAGRESFGPVVDLAVIDEASQTLLPYSVPVFARARRAAVIGDENQLQPIVDLPKRVLRDLAVRVLGNDIHLRKAASGRLAYDRSALGAVWDPRRDRGTPGRSLREHFRCREAIISFCDRICGYGLRVETPDVGLAEGYGREGSLLDYPVLVLDVPGRHVPVGGSYSNKEEAGAAVEMLRRLWWSLAGYLDGEDLRDLAAVVTPYRAQAWAVRSRIRRDPELGPFLRPREDGSRLTVGTVHALQGDEKPVVVLSMTIARGKGGFQFVNRSHNLLNVAVSRACRLLVIVADAGRLAEERGPWVGVLWDHVRRLEEAGRARRIRVKDLADPALW